MPGADIRETGSVHSKPKATGTLSRFSEFLRHNRTLGDISSLPISSRHEELVDALGGDAPLASKPVRLQFASLDPAPYRLAAHVQKLGGFLEPSPRAKPSASVAALSTPVEN